MYSKRFTYYEWPEALFQIRRLKREMMIEETAWGTFPAKTVAVDGKTELGVSVLQHGLLAGEVFRQFRTLRRWNALDELLPETLVGLIGAHDVGKANPLFLNKLLKHVSEEDKRLWFDAFDVDPSWFRLLESGLSERMKEKLEIRHEAVSVAVLLELHANHLLAHETVGCHHEKELTQVLGVEAYLGGPLWQNGRIALTREILKELGGNEQWLQFSDSICENKVIRKLWAGALVLSDWIASRKENSYPQGEQREIASKLLQDAGFEHVTPVKKTDFSDLFGYAPRRLQAEVSSLYKGPGIYVLEAPTGYGKTEAALALATQALARGDADGLYFALPTQLTSNRMVDRVREYVAALYGEEKTVRLLHSGARTSALRMGMDAAPGEDWFRPNRQALLAPFSVGTVDQALLASLPARFSSLRLAGLAGKVVIFDEIHSYDTYTSELIRKLLQDLRTLKAVVVILSATLTDGTLAGLLEEDPSVWKQYRSAMRCTVKTDEISVREWTVAPQENHPVWLRLSEQEEPIFEEVVRRVQSGERVLWIENTVRKAQDVARRFQSMGLPFGLLHSKFRPVERRENETYWTSTYGKAGKGSRNQGTGSVLVGTQVLEQSLDLDADFLVSRLAPFDLLVQRIGRLWRHADTPRPAACTRAETMILKDPSDDPDCPFPSFVYYPYVLARTYEVLRSLPTDRAQPFPGSVRELLERVYEKRDESENPVMHRLQTEMEEDSERKIAAAESAETNRQSEREEPLTRYIELPTHEVLVIRKSELDPIPENPGELAVWAEERILRSERVFSGCTCKSWDGWPEKVRHFFQSAGRFSSMPLRLLEEERMIDPLTGNSDGRYSKKFGLWFECDVK